jgi:hypothetical protein
MDEKASSDYEEYLTDDAEKELSNRYKFYKKFNILDTGCCTCFFSCCSCCSKDDGEISKKYYINKWRKYLVR